MNNYTKQALRERMLELLRSQKEEDRVKKSGAILDELFRLPEFERAKTILFYASFNGEVDTFEMIKQAQKQGKTVGLPKIIEENKNIIPIRVGGALEECLEQGPYGIAQPKTTDAQDLNPEDLDMVIVPGVAFDQENNRLGRGAGYYDRFLKRLRPETPTVGLAFDFQIVQHLPPKEEHDVAVSHVISR